jgi:hypothetical protein
MRLSVMADYFPVSARCVIAKGARLRGRVTRFDNSSVELALYETAKRSGDDKGHDPEFCTWLRGGGVASAARAALEKAIGYVRRTLMSARPRCRHRGPHPG